MLEELVFAVIEIIGSALETAFLNVRKRKAEASQTRKESK